MITGMTLYPQAVIFKGRVYIGGGSAEYKDQNAIVTCYDIERDYWIALPRYREELFAMATINEELMLIGGRQPYTNKTSRTIGMWSEQLQTWRFSDSDSEGWCALLTACDAATAIAYDNRWLIVVGGRDNAYQSLSKVDIIDVTDHQSYSGAKLPQPAHKMTAAVIDSTLVLLGGLDFKFLNKVFCVKLDHLISQAVSSDSISISPWQSLPDTPVVSCTAVAFNGVLLAIGGNKPEDWNPKYVHIFNPDTRKWTEAGQLLVARLRCACTVLPSGEMFITGGSSNSSGFQKEVHIATLQ